VDVLPANRLALDPGRVESSLVGIALDAACHAFAGAALDATEPFDVDVDELARPAVLVPDRLLQAEPSEAAEPEPGQDPRDRRQRHRERFGDLCGGEAQSAQRDDHLDPLGGCAVGDPPRRRGAIEQAGLALQLVAAHPLTTTAHADACGLGRRRQRPPLDHDPLCQLPPATPAESGVTVKLHPVPSLD
jgi:hypothetical protein